MAILRKRIGASCFILAGLAAALGGAASGTPLEYASTINKPVTLQLVDPNTKSVVWEKEIPVNYHMTVWIHHPGDILYMKVSDAPADSIEWKLYNPGGGFTTTAAPVKQGKDKLSGGPVVLNYVIRPHPQYPRRYVPPVPLGTAELGYSDRNAAEPAGSLPPGAGAGAETGTMGEPVAIVPTAPPIPAPPSRRTPAGPIVPISTEIEVTSTTLTVGGRNVSLGELTSVLSAIGKEDPHRSVIITALDPSDPATAVRLAKVQNACTAAGLANVHLNAAEAFPPLLTPGSPAPGSPAPETQP